MHHSGSVRLPVRLMPRLCVSSAEAGWRALGRRVQLSKGSRACRTRGITGQQRTWHGAHLLLGLTWLQGRETHASARGKEGVSKAADIRPHPSKSSPAGPVELGWVCSQSKPQQTHLEPPPRGFLFLAETPRLSPHPSARSWGGGHQTGLAAVGCPMPIRLVLENWHLNPWGGRRAILSEQIDSRLLSAQPAARTCSVRARVVL